jgi:hypothetical protein
MYSGGIGSFMAASRLVEKYGRDRVKLLFTDTKTEDIDLYRFLDQTVDYLGCDFVHLEDGRDIWQVFTDERFMGNSRIDPCSKLLKRIPAKRYIRKNCTPEDTVLVYGIDWTEIHRYDTLKKRWGDKELYSVAAPMCQRPYMAKHEGFDKLHEIGIKRPRLYDMGFPHNNCGGFCVKGGLTHFANLLDKLPENYAHHEEQQEKLFKEIGKRPFLVKTTNKIKKYLSLKDYRIYLENNKAPEFDWGGCGCFLD